MIWGTLKTPFVAGVAVVLKLPSRKLILYRCGASVGCGERTLGKSTSAPKRYILCSPYWPWMDIDDMACTKTHFVAGVAVVLKLPSR